MIDESKKRLMMGWEKESWRSDGKRIYEKDSIRELGGEDGKIIDLVRYAQI